MSTYQWTESDEDTAGNAVIVGIGNDRPLTEEAGLAAGPILASVCWPHRMFRGDKVEARMEGPFEPAVALSYVEEIAKLYALPRVVVAIQSLELWNDAWGTLAPKRGLDR